MPSLQRLPPGETVRAVRRRADHLGFDEYDVANAGADLPPLPARGRDARGFSIPFRYVWPAELDLMARLAGMTLRERWGGWTREPFTAESTKHVSVWETPAG